MDCEFQQEIEGIEGILCNCEIDCKYQIKKSAGCETGELRGLKINYCNNKLIEADKFDRFYLLMGFR